LPEEYINSNNNILDFCLRANINSNFYFQHGNNRYNKILRYYISKKGESLIKCKSETCKTNAALRTDMNVGCKTTILNKISNDKEHLENINREWYIQECYKIIKSMELGKKIKTTISPKEQLSLF
jgi:hypothetical protein